MRSHIAVRAATMADLAELVDMCSETAELAASAPRNASPGSENAALASLVTEALEDPTCRIFIATISGEAAGMAVAAFAPPAPLTSAPYVQVSHVLVRARYRRRGVGRALLDSAAIFADDGGAEHVVVSASPTSREINRFYAQLGFSPMAVRRVAPVSALRRRIASLDHRAAPNDSLARRRHLASRQIVRTAFRRFPIASGIAEQAREP